MAQCIKRFGAILFTLSALLMLSPLSHAGPEHDPNWNGMTIAAANPCAYSKAKNPCAANPCAANPCAAKNPCAANPCAANPCAAKNPCAANPCAAKPMCCQESMRR